MIVGFTGTQKGMTRAQQMLLDEFLEGAWEPLEFHHGCCIGADEEAHKIAEAKGANIVIHPPAIKNKMAKGLNGTYLYPKPYLDRNRDIVNACDILVATPKSRHEEVRSGTWFTIRFARLKDKQVYLIFP